MQNLESKQEQSLSMALFLMSERAAGKQVNTQCVYLVIETHSQTVKHKVGGEVAFVGSSCV